MSSPLCPDDAQRTACTLYTDHDSNKLFVGIRQSRMLNCALCTSADGNQTKEKHTENSVTPPGYLRAAPPGAVPFRQMTNRPSR